MRKEIHTSVKIFDKIAEKYEFTAYFLSFGFLPYWFNKYTKVFEWPILFYDLKKENEN